MKDSLDGPQAARQGPAPSLMVGLVGLLCVIWGSTWLVIREGLEALPPFTSAAARFAFAALLMIPVAAALSGREGGDRPPLWLVFATGSLQFAVSYGIVYWAEQYLSSALTSILWACYPLMMAAAGHVAIPGERLHRSQTIGFLAGFAGVVLLFATDISNAGPDAMRAAGVLFLSPFVVAIATVLLKRSGGGVSSLRLNRDSMVVGAAMLIVLAFAVEEPLHVTWTGPAVLSVAYLAVVGTVVAFSIYLWLLRYAPANKLAVIPYISPAVALTLGVVVADEPITVMTPAGLLMILLGVVLVTRAKRRAVSAIPADAEAARRG